MAGFNTSERNSVQPRNRNLNLDLNLPLKSDTNIYPQKTEMTNKNYKNLSPALTFESGVEDPY